MAQRYDIKALVNSKGVTFHQQQKDYCHKEGLCKYGIRIKANAIAHVKIDSETSPKWRFEKGK
jgi:hypothetical protein